ncbi:hypothetical protein PR001_g32632 [Phytophthora rubi]|uniref:Uncharacterized protein n=1 Tax=Phytophthora rubi TaxID=129364 RepID=A0A6A3GC94_9STRA|nr:hypothetical protein PR001_g32632 [Phytophthora rubi]
MPHAIAQAQGAIRAVGAALGVSPRCHCLLLAGSLSLTLSCSSIPAGQRKPAASRIRNRVMGTRLVLLRSTLLLRVR